MNKCSEKAEKKDLKDIDIKNIAFLKNRVKNTENVIKNVLNRNQ